MERSSLVTNMAGTVSRNDPCPCGSGLKFKKCCQNKALAAPLADRAAPLPPISPRPGVRSDTLAKAASAHWAAGRSAEALAAFREVARLEPKSADAYNNLGAALAASGHLAEAVVHLQRAVELRPSFGAALRNLSGVLEHLGREREAADAFRRHSRVTKDPVDRRLSVAKFLSLEGASSDAEVELRRAVAAAPHSSRAHG